MYIIYTLKNKTRDQFNKETTSTYFFGIIVQVRVVFRKTVVGD